MTSFSFAYNRFTKDIWYDPATFADCAAVTTGEDPVTPNGMSCGRCVASALIVTSVITLPRSATNNSAATILTLLVVMTPRHHRSHAPRQAPARKLPR